MALSLNDVLIWQLADSAFPAGGFAHSGGLEAAWQAGEVPSVDALRQFVRDALWQAGRGVLPLASAAHDDPGGLDRLDALCHVFLTNVVVRRASCVQGRAFAATCAEVWPGGAAVLHGRAQRLHGHYAPIVGAVLSTIGVPLGATQQLVLYQVLRGVLSAAVRLGIIGPYAAQRLQLEGAEALLEVLAACATLRDQDIAQTAPILDLLHAGHDRLYSRLFQS